MTTDANQLLMGSGAPGAKFDQIGTVVTGTLIREPEARQQHEFRTKLPETWKDGSPKMMVVVHLATSLRDPERPDDDGTRTLYIQGKNLTDAVRQAVRAAKADGLHTGGTLTVQYVADGQAEPGMSPPKIYAASYTSPPVSFNGVTGPAQTAPAVQQAAPVQQQYAPGFAPQQPFPAAQPAAPAASAAPAGVAASVLGAPAGVDPQVWGRLDPQQRERVLAAMGQPAQAQPGY